MKADHFQVHKNFSSNAKALEDYYQSVFSKPLEATSERFCWDYWHVADQYTHLRTPAWEFFPEDIYSDWHNTILQFGREFLGCHEITPPWLSCYIDGCKQNLHADLPHGPWAFVFSLTPWKKKTFSGGETLIMKPEILDYWVSMDRSKGLSPNDIFDKVEPEFNQLLVFDPRFPHGVNEVRGTQDPAHARIVMHGWFTEPRPWVTGGLQSEEDVVAENLNDFIEVFLKDNQAFDGLLTLRISVSTDGSVAGIKVLSNTLVGMEKDLDFKNLKKFKFAKASLKSEITLPLIFSS